MSSDLAVVQLRRLLLEAIDDVEQGKAPRGADPETHVRIRPYDTMIEGSGDWKTSWAAHLTAKW